MRRSECWRRWERMGGRGGRSFRRRRYIGCLRPAPKGRRGTAGARGRGEGIKTTGRIDGFGSWGFLGMRGGENEAGDEEGDDFGGVGDHGPCVVAFEGVGLGLALVLEVLDLGGEVHGDEAAEEGGHG